MRGQQVISVSEAVAAPSEAAQNERVPLVLDLDGTLLRTDLLHETAVAYVKANPLRAFKLVFWLLQGKSVLKRRLSERVPLNVESLPVNEELAWLAQAAHDEGRRVGIATAADELLARRVARRFDFVDFVIASNGATNLKGNLKAQRLAERFPKGFAYAGDSRSDLNIWRAASEILLVGASPSTVRAARALGKPVEAEIPKPASGLRGWLKALRVHQWAKNVLVFVPLVLSGMAAQPSALMAGAVAFAAISLMASGTYLLNDLFDLADDRAHWTKRNRPLASGMISIKRAIPAALGLIVVSLGAAAWLGLSSLVMLTVYMATTLGYSFYLKRQPVLDAFTLAALFTLRLGIGITAVSAPPSPWLLVFSMFLFASLSFAKRQTEIQRSAAAGRSEIGGRGYLVGDAAFVLAMGVASGISSIVIMVLYIMNDMYPADFYSQPIVLWVLPAMLFLWMSRIWLLCHRGQLNDDPVAFAIRDKLSIVMGAAMGAAFLAGWLA